MEHITLTQIFIQNGIETWEVKGRERENKFPYFHAFTLLRVNMNYILCHFSSEAL